MAKRPAPTLDEERSLWAQGHRYVVGMDEVGKGAWAGPLTIGAAVVPGEAGELGIRDSKLLGEAERERLFPLLTEWCVTWAVGHASNVECDRFGMNEAQRLAARRALSALAVTPDRVLVDGRWDFVGGGITRSIVKGDQTCLSIATASILAKVTRDRMMRELGEEYPTFDFAANKGYPSPHHRRVLHEIGPTRLHRRSWAFMDDLDGHERLRRGEATLFDSTGS